MHSSSLLSVAVATALSLPLAVWAADETPIQAQIEQLKQDYEARLQALEAQSNAKTESTQASASRFNPAIALILSGTYANLSNDPEGYRIQGFIPGGEEVGPGSKSFSLGESELTLSANVDQKFSGALTFALGGDSSVGVEEAFIETLGLDYGFNLKFGRFLSGLGYLNNKHAHVWDFVDAPLAYQGFFGGQYKNDGLQLRWLAPTDQFVELGAELGLGAEFPGAERNRNGAGVSTLFARFGDDLSDSASWQGNAWYQHSNAQNREYEDEDSTASSVTNAFAGRSNTWGLGVVYKWNPNGNKLDRGLKLQAEFIQRKETGELTYDTQNVSLGTATGVYNSSQSGWYAQAVYQVIRNWRVGLRYDQLNSGSLNNGLVQGGSLSAADFSRLLGFTPKRSTVMFDYSPSEFSLLRLQLSQDKASPRGNDMQVFLQYVMSLGAHGAHSY